MPVGVAETEIFGLRDGVRLRVVVGLETGTMYDTSLDSELSREAVR